MQWVCLRTNYCNWKVVDYCTGALAAGATGDKGAILLISNPGIANGVAGLSGGASYQSAVDRGLLWLRRDEVVQPYGLKVSEVVQAVSDLRNRLDGPLVRFLPIIREMLV